MFWSLSQKIFPWIFTPTSSTTNYSIKKEDEYNCCSLVLTNILQIIHLCVWDQIRMNSWSHLEITFLKLSVSTSLKIPPNSNIFTDKFNHVPLWLKSLWLFTWYAVMLHKHTHTLALQLIPASEQRDSRLTGWIGLIYSPTPSWSWTLISAMFKIPPDS